MKITALIVASYVATCCAGAQISMKSNAPLSDHSPDASNTRASNIVDAYEGGAYALPQNDQRLLTASITD